VYRNRQIPGTAAILVVAVVPRNRKGTTKMLNSSHTKRRPGGRGPNKISRPTISEAIRAAAAAGYREVEVRPDGSVRLVGAPQAGWQDWPADGGAA